MELSITWKDETMEIQMMETAEILPEILKIIMFA